MAKSKCTMTFTGFEKILSDIESIDKRAEKAIEKAITKAGDMATQEYKKVIEKHRYSGVTEESLAQGQTVENTGDTISLQTGFDLDKGGLASIFLDRGTPTTKPVNYTKSIKRNRNIKKAIKDTLDKELNL